MPINEKMRTRSRWPVQFDIEGVPRDTRVRTERITEQAMKISGVSPKGEFNMSKPVTVPYSHQEYPRRMYRGAQGINVGSREEEESKLHEGWSLKRGAAPDSEPAEEVQQDDPSRDSGFTEQDPEAETSEHAETDSPVSEDKPHILRKSGKKKKSA